MSHHLRLTKKSFSHSTKDINSRIGYGSFARAILGRQCDFGCTFRAMTSICHSQKLTFEMIEKDLTYL